MEEANARAFAELKRIASRLEAITAICRTSNSPCRKAALHAADARREANGKSGAESRGRLVREGVIGEDEAVLRVDPAALDQLLHPTLDPNASKELIASGLAASPGAATAKWCSQRTRRRCRGGRARCHLWCGFETSPRTFTDACSKRHPDRARWHDESRRGGRARHGAPLRHRRGALKVDAERGVMAAGASTIARGEIVTIDGGGGQGLSRRVRCCFPR